VRAAPDAIHIPPEIRSDGSTEIRYSATYYPDSVTPQSAVPLDILPGADRTGIDIRLVRAPIVAVRGTVSGIAAGMSAFLEVRKVEPPRGPGTGRGDGNLRLGDPVNPDGSFVVWGLDPGTYLFIGPSDGAGWQSAPVEVTIAGKNVNGIRVAMTRQLTISGQVVPADDGARLPPVPREASLGQQKQISLREVSSDAQEYAVVADDGSFQLTQVAPGRYSVRLTWGPYVQSMRLGSTEVDGEILDLRNGANVATLTVNASSASSEIAGVVRNSSGPVAHARVALVEEGTGGWPWVIDTSAEGHYSFPNVRPGKYRLLVLDSEMAYANALRFQLVDYADIIETIDLSPGERVTRDLRAHDPK
jgi:hypothetical protein